MKESDKWYLYWHVPICNDVTHINQTIVIIRWVDGEYFLLFRNPSNLEGIDKIVQNHSYVASVLSVSKGKGYLKVEGFYPRAVGDAVSFGPQIMKELRGNRLDDN